MWQACHSPMYNGQSYCRPMADLPQVCGRPAVSLVMYMGVWQACHIPISMAMEVLLACQRPVTDLHMSANDLLQASGQPEHTASRPATGLLQAFFS